MSKNFKKHKKTIITGAIILIALAVISVLFVLNNPDSPALRGRSWIILLGLVVVMVYSGSNLLKKKSKKKKKRKF